MAGSRRTNSRPTDGAATLKACQPMHTGKFVEWHHQVVHFGREIAAVYDINSEITKKTIYKYKTTENRRKKLEIKQ